MKAHVVGAGLAGLSAAIELARAGVEVSLTEAAPRAGGRCRSYHDPQIGQVIDNGNHFTLIWFFSRCVWDHNARCGCTNFF